MRLAYLTNPPVEITWGANIELGDVHIAYEAIMLWSEADRNAEGVGTIVEPTDPVPYGQRETGLTLALVEGQAVRQRVTEAVPLSDLKAAALEALADRRRTYEAQVVYQGMAFAWDDKTENRVANAVKALDLQPEVTSVDWEVTRGVFAPLTPDFLRGLGVAAFNRVQDAFQCAKAGTTAILAAEDAAALAAIDLDSFFAEPGEP